MPIRRRSRARLAPGFGGDEAPAREILDQTLRSADPRSAPASLGLLSRRAGRPADRHLRVQIGADGRGRGRARLYDLPGLRGPRPRHRDGRRAGRDRRTRAARCRSRTRSRRRMPRTGRCGATASPCRRGRGSRGRPGLALGKAAPDDPARRSLLVVPQPLFLFRDRPLSRDDRGLRPRNRAEAGLSARHPPARFLRAQPSQLARLCAARRGAAQPVSRRSDRPAEARPDRPGPGDAEDRRRAAPHLPPRAARPGGGAARAGDGLSATRSRG